MRTIIIIALFSFCLPIAAQNDDLIRLDKAISQVESYHQARRDRICAASRTSSFENELTLVDLYSDFDVDSAICHLDRAESFPKYDRWKTLLRRIALYNSSLMMYKDAADLFSTVRKDSLSAENLVAYYTIGVQLNKNLEELSADSELRVIYGARKRAFRDSVLMINSGSSLILANKYVDDGNYTAAAALMEKEISDRPYSAKNGAAYHVAASIYGLQGLADRQLHYLALAARADIENGVREYMALPQLALMLYERGDYERAYRYMQRSVADATDCKARVRMFELSQIMPVIESAHNERLQRSRAALAFFLGLAALLLVVLTAILAYARKRARLLQEARRRETEANGLLVKANEVKEKYVTRFMNLSLDYLIKMDKYRAELFKIASKRNFDELYDAIESTRYIDAEVKDFYRRFDEAFLELYPDFVDVFNSQLRPDCRVKLKNGESLNTELRVFALMKLGISDGELIAKFLRCSQSTVYNYRARMRNRAVDRDAFDAFFS